MTSTVDALGAAQYLLVTTFRKDGRAVPTPGLGARDGDALVFWSVTDAGKIKRIRRTADVLVGPCDLRGRPTGEQVPGHARSSSTAPAPSTSGRCCAASTA